MLELAFSVERAGILHRRGIITYKHFKALVLLTALDDRPHVEISPMGWKFTERKAALKMVYAHGYKWCDEQWVFGRRGYYYPTKNP